MLVNLFILFVLIMGALPLMLVLNKRFEQAIPLTCVSTVLILFVLGLCRVLVIGTPFICSLFLLGGASTIIYIIKNKKVSEFSRQIFTPGFVIFFIFYLLISYFNAGLLASSWDEFTHWMDITKVMVTINDFGTNPESHSYFMSYPPAMSLFQYFVEKIYLYFGKNHVFNEWRAYFAYQVFTFSFFFPFFSKLSFKNVFSNLCIALVFLISPLLFFSNIYNSVYIDPVLGVVAGCIVGMLFITKQRDLYMDLYVFLSCAVLILLKDVGLLLAIFVGAAYLYFILKNNPDFTKCKKLSYVGVYLVSIIVPKYLWKFQLYITHASIKFGEKVSPLVLIKVILGKDNSYRQTVYKNYINGLFEKKLELGYLGISLNYLILILIAIFLFFVIFHISTHFLLSDENKKKNYKIITVVLSCEIIVYVIGLCNTYMTSFSEYEAVRLASFERYLNIVLLQVWISFLIVLFDYISNLNKNSKLWTYLIFIFVITIIPSKKINAFFFKDNTTFSKKVRDKYEPLHNQIVKHCEPKSNIYFISQWDTGFDYWVSRYNARPAYISTSKWGGWSIGKKKNKDDIWTASMEVDEWMNYLVESYDYVAIYRTNDYFIETYGVLFEDEIKTDCVYKVNKQNKKLELCHD